MGSGGLEDRREEAAVVYLSLTHTHTLPPTNSIVRESAVRDSADVIKDPKRLT